MKQGDSQEALNYLNKTPYSFSKPPTHAYDYDGNTRRICVVRSSAEKPGYGDASKRFGVFLGEIDSKFIVVIKSNNIINGCEIFDTLEECKSEWKLD